MAEKEENNFTRDVFWSNIEMDSSGEDAYIPGLSAPGNKRPSRVKVRRTAEIQPKIPLSQPLVEDVLSSPDDEAAKQQKLSQDRKAKARQSRPMKPRQGGQVKMKKPVDLSCDNGSEQSDSGANETFAERSIRRLNRATASLKDLRPEDKQRVANLIKELAKVGEEKERVVQELHGEREHHEKQIMTLVEQQEKILSEREDIQTKLFQCQQLLTEYQGQLLNKQDRINTSIANIREDDVNGPKNTQQQAITNAPPPSVAPIATQVAPIATQAGPIATQVAPVPTKVVECVDISNTDLERELTSILDFTPRPIENHLQSHSKENRLYHGEGGTDPVTDLLQNKTPEDNIKRPYTSLIDKEIARERSLSRSSHGSARSRSRSASPMDGRPKFMYPPKIRGTGPLNEPVASSTHKSMEIKENLVPHDIDLDSPRSSLRGSSVRGQSPVDKGLGQGHGNHGNHSKVVFSDKQETSDGAKMHSPNLKNPKMFNDPVYAQYYKKLSPSGRKRELLKQRQALLDEQERLRVILEKQEKALKLRQYEYQKREELQKERMEFYKEGGKFPALRLDFDGESESGTQVNVNIETAEDRLVVNGRENRQDRETEAMDVGRVTPQNVDIDEDIQIRSRVSASTSPMVTPRAQKISMATSPSPPDDEDYTTPRLVDAATSISYRTPLTDTSNRQGNLPLQSNRQKTSPFIKQPINKKDKDGVTRSPGEKTLNVIELVNSLDEGPGSLNNSYNRPNIENRPAQSVRKAAGKTASPKGTFSTAHRYQSSQKKQISMDDSDILEDIFFLK